MMNICSGSLELCSAVWDFASLGFSSLGSYVWEYNQDPSVGCTEKGKIGKYWGLQSGLPTRQQFSLSTLNIRVREIEFIPQFENLLLELTQGVKGMIYYYKKS